MGWDYVTYGDRAELLHDMQLWALRHFLADAAATLAAEEPGDPLSAEARDFFASWGWPAPGVVSGTRLDDFVRGSPERAAALVRVCDRATDRLGRFGEVVPLEYLEANINATSPGGVYIAEQPSASFRQAVARIRGLLAAEPPRPEATEPEPRR